MSNSTTPNEILELAQAYCRKYSSEEAANKTEDFEIYESAFELVKSKPEDGLRFILEVLDQDPNDFAFANLAAGPLEDLLAFHGDRMIDRLEREAKANPAFDDLLGGVLLGRLKPDIAKRVANARSAIWKD